MIEQAITQVTQSYGIDPYEINNGCCFEWAEEVLDRLRDSNHKVEMWESLFGFADTNHAFLRIDGMFYDAESPNGVQDHMELPLFAKIFTRIGKRQPVWIVDTNHNEQVEKRRDITQEMLVEYDRDAKTNNSGQFPEHNLTPEI